MYFRSRPVFDVKTRLLPLTKEIKIDGFNCLEKGNGALVDMSTCFKAEETTKSDAGVGQNQWWDTLTDSYILYTHCHCLVLMVLCGFAVAKGAYVNITYTLRVDPARPTSRGFFDETGKSRIHTSSIVLTREECFNHTIFMPVSSRSLYTHSAV